jgi:outer membrane receptor for ferrienterochelin and colicin
LFNTLNFGILFMRMCNLRSLNLTILGWSSGATFAESSSKNSSTYQLSTIVVSATGFWVVYKKCASFYLVADCHLITTLQNHRLTLGAEYKKAKNIDDIEGWEAGFEKDADSFYAEDEWHLMDHLHLSFAGRYEDHSGFDGHFSPRAYI